MVSANEVFAEISGKLYEHLNTRKWLNIPNLNQVLFYQLPTIREPLLFTELKEYMPFINSYVFPCKKILSH